MVTLNDSQFAMYVGDSSISINHGKIILNSEIFCFVCVCFTSMCYINYFFILFISSNNFVILILMKNCFFYADPGVVYGTIDFLTQDFLTKDNFA